MREVTIGLGILIAGIWFVWVLGYCIWKANGAPNTESRSDA